MAENEYEIRLSISLNSRWRIQNGGPKIKKIVYTFAHQILFIEVFEIAYHADLQNQDGRPNLSQSHHVVSWFCAFSKYKKTLRMQY